MSYKMDQDTHLELLDDFDETSHPFYREVIEAEEPEEQGGSYPPDYTEEDRIKDYMERVEEETRIYLKFVDDYMCELWNCGIELSPEIENITRERAFLYYYYHLNKQWGSKPEFTLEEILRGSFELTLSCIIWLSLDNDGNYIMDRPLTMSDYEYYLEMREVL